MKLLKITSVINRITLTGTLDLDKGQTKKVKIINKLCLITATLAFIIGNIFYYKTGLLAIEIPAMIEGTLFCSVIYLNYRKKNKLANLLFVAIFCVSALYFGAILGEIINLRLIAIFLISVSFIIFSDLKTQIISCSFTLLTIALSEMNLYNEWFLPIEMTRANQFFIRWIALAVFIFFDTMVLRYYVQENSKLRAQQEAHIARQAKLLHQLKSAYSIIKTGFYKASHEFKNQLNPISGSLDILDYMIKKDSKLKPVEEYIKIMSTSIKNIGMMINNILTTSKFGSNEVYEPDYKTFILNQLIQETVDQHAPLADENGQQIVYKIDANVPSIIVMDELVLMLSFTNLLNNAIKYANNYSTIYVNAFVKEDNCFITVTNNCADINPDIQEDLFSPFVRNKKHGKKVAGTGLGLYVVRLLMQAVLGNVSMNSMDGFTEFTLNFPLKKGNESDIEPEVNMDIDLRGFNVLIVDDSRPNLFVLEKLLTVKGCIVSQAENGLEVLESIRHSIPDLIILDMNMPVMDGKTTLKSLQQHDVYKKIPVIIATGDPFGPAFIRRWQKNGAKDVILKPMSSKSLVSTLKRNIVPKVEIITGT